MYKLTVDCGTYNDTFLIDNVEDYREYTEEFEQHYSGSTEDLLEKGIICCGIDTLTLEEVSRTENLTSQGHRASNKL